METANKEPIYVQIASYLREQILTGTLPAGQGISSEGELCKKFGVSRGPIRQAMDILVKERLINRKPGLGTFVNSTIRPASDDRTKPFSILVVVDAEPEMQWHRFMFDIIQDLNAVAAETHPVCRLSFEFHKITPEMGRDFFNRTDVDGIFFIPLSSATMEFLAGIVQSQKKIPAVTFFRKIDSSVISNFYIDLEEGAFRAASYLTSLGHSRIALLVVAPIEARIDSHCFLCGYDRARKQRGIEHDDALILETGVTAAGVKHVLRAAFEGANRPTALMVGGNALEGPAVRALAEMDLRTPEDVSLIVFDDSVEAKLHEPPLTVVRQPSMRGTRMALERLLAEIRDHALTPVSVVVKPELIVRDSCESI